MTEGHSDSSISCGTNHYERRGEAARAVLHESCQAKHTSHATAPCTLLPFLLALGAMRQIQSCYCGAVCANRPWPPSARFVAKKVTRFEEEELVNQLSLSSIDEVKKPEL